MPTARPLSSAAAWSSAISHQPPEPSTTTSIGLNQLRIDECRPARGFGGVPRNSASASPQA